ncbi:MAG: hypothetical protein IPH24_14635 [Crocinitomicaceae bacterium]|nr:hypothetical protein [Crocinitomicaceae bacterium]
MLKKFDFILIPTEKAIPSFLYFKKEEQIKIIPQGVRQKDIKLKKNESKGTIPHFIFAANFIQGA